MAQQKLPGWMQDHLDRYLASNGKDGHIWNGVPTLLLTTTGKQSGEPRQLPLIYGKAEDKYVVVASKGGNPRHPSWCVNLMADPNVQVQVNDDRFAARARIAEGDERQRLWDHMAGVFPTYNEYAARTSRRIPVVVLERQQ